VKTVIRLLVPSRVLDFVTVLAIVSCLRRILFDAVCGVYKVSQNGKTAVLRCLCSRSVDEVNFCRGKLILAGLLR
jgi:hypothetical protein